MNNFRPLHSTSFQQRTFSILSIYAFFSNFLTFGPYTFTFIEVIEAKKNRQLEPTDDTRTMIAGRSKADMFTHPMLYGTAWKKERTTKLMKDAFSLGFRGLDTACQPKHYDEKRII